MPQIPWFNLECEQKRRLYHEAKNKYDSEVNTSNKESLKIASKCYKQKINWEYKKYHDNLIVKLRNLKSSNPKEYWDIIKDGEQGNNKEGNITME